MLSTQQGSLLVPRSVGPARSIPVLRRYVRTTAVKEKGKHADWNTLGKKQASARELGRDSSGWGVLRLDEYNRGWTVPWGPWTLVGGLGLWFVSFVAVGFLVVPTLYKLSGGGNGTLSSGDAAEFTLATQVAETIVTVALLNLITLKHKDKLKDAELFNYDLDGPFKRPKGWASWAILGCLCAPLVVGLTATLMSNLGYDDAVSGGRGTVDGVVPMITMDGSTYVNLLLVTGILAPYLEEAVFRGFMLTSLTKYIPTWAAVFISSLAFGAAHLSARDFPVLVALGILLGFSYIRSRNLWTPMIIHGTWNSTVLSILFYLTASGVDVEQLLKELP